MTTAPVDIARRIDDVFRREGAEGLIARFGELFTADYEFHPGMTGSVEGQAYVGLEGLRAWWANLSASFERFEVETEGIVPVGHDAALLIGRVRARGRESGVELDRELGRVIRVRDGRVCFGRSFVTHAEAFEAAAELARTGASTHA